MDKRTVLAFLLIALIMVAMPYYYEMIGLAPETPPEDEVVDRSRPSFDTPTTTPESRDAVPEILSRSFDQETNEENVFYLETPLYVAGISSRGGGTLTSFALKGYPLNDTSLVNLVHPEINRDNLMLRFRTVSGEDVALNGVWRSLFSQNSGDTVHVRDDNITLNFNSKIEERIVSKSLTFHHDRYTLDVAVDLQGISRDVVSQEQFALFWNGGIPSTEPNKRDEASFYAANLSQGREVTKHNGKDGNIISSTGRTDWTAIRSKYFTAAIIPTSASNYGEVKAKRHDNPGSNGNGEAPLYDMAVGFSSAAPATAVIYVGPLHYNTLKSLDVGLENTMSMGIAPIRGISRGVLFLLVALYKVIPNYGLVLILFSVLVKIVVHPLTKKSYQSMKEMQAIQPQLLALKDKYKGDPQKLNQATMKMYKEHGVNPLGGCLPMLLQMPLLFALFIVFRSTIELRGAPFVLWIDDLSQPDALIPLPFSIPMYGDQISLLPLFMGVSMFVQQKMTTSEANPQQKLMTRFMSVFFVILFNQFPSGLNLYYTLFNVLTILQQKYLVHPKTPLVPAPTGR